ncbi:MAG: helix-turn-helix domain-containing protein [Patescibacteria group bacterium]|nr:helix-turn-helix domain-containing protein [Patescibacteria group bacterium]
METVSDYFHIPQRDMVGTKRKKEIMQARQVYMYMIKHELGYALERIGEIFGGKNHTTVMHSINKITTELEVDPDGSLAKDMRNLRHKLSD